MLDNPSNGNMALMPATTRKSKTNKNNLSGRNRPVQIAEDENVLSVSKQFIASAPEVISEEQPIVRLDKNGQPLKSDGKQLEPYHFKKGQSGNPSGRPKDIVREIGKKIAALQVKNALKPKERELAVNMGLDPGTITLLESLMLKLATSANPMKTALYLERTFGKVPNININAEVDAQLVARFRSKFTDSELEGIASGESPLDILLEKLPDIEPMEDDDLDVDALPNGSDE